MYSVSRVRICSQNAFKASEKFGSVKVLGTVITSQLLSDVTIYLNLLKRLKRSFSNYFSTEYGLHKFEDCVYSKNMSNKSCRMSSVSVSGEVPVLRLEDYDCIGFDLDNTVCEYNISSSVEMEYDILANFLVKEKGYDPYYLLKPLDENSIDFLQRGLLVDFAHGNLLKICDNGTICKASHGTRFMTEEEIINAYGNDKKWKVTSEFCKNMLVAWNGPLSERVRALLDYFDMPASLAFARIIDSLDYKLGRPADIYNVWPDVIAGLQDMYKREHFIERKGGYFHEVKSNPARFIKQCNPLVLEWLKKIKDSKVTFLVTGSNCDFASLTAETCLGKNWKSLFDIVICYARKPGFFTGCRPFIQLDGFMETDPLDDSNLEIGQMYSQGNWQQLYQWFGKTLAKKEPRCLYFGDNLVQDVYTPAEYTKCDTVAVVEELIVKSTTSVYDDKNNHPAEAILSSESWGSYFVNEKEHSNTLWGSVITNNSKICIPNLSVIAQYSLNHEFTTFCKGSSDGYFPVKPDTAKKVNVV